MKDDRIKKITVLAETRFLNLFDAEYKNKKHQEKHWIIASRKDFKTLQEQFFQGKEETTDAVVIAALHEPTKRLVVIKQFRIPLNDYVYELPAGLIDNNESMEKSTDRELKEETGLTLDKINYAKSKIGVYASSGMTDESMALVYCTCNGQITNEFLEDDEDIEAILVSKEEAEELIKKDVKMDIKLYMVLQGFASLGEKLWGADYV